MPTCISLTDTGYIDIFGEINHEIHHFKLKLSDCFKWL